MAESICKNCNEPIKQYFPVGWAHKKSIDIHCYPNALDGSPDYDLVATPIDKEGTRLGKEE